MKRYIAILAMLALLPTLAACAAALTAVPLPLPPACSFADPEPLLGSFSGKIAIITLNARWDEEVYRSAEQVVKKYGEDKVLHITWPDMFPEEQGQMIVIVAEIAADPDIKALIINPPVSGTNDAVGKLQELRDDVFVVYCSPWEETSETMQVANLALSMDIVGMGPAMAEQAYKMGAKTFVHYSFLRHMLMPELAARRDKIAEKCAELGMEFVYSSGPDPTGDYYFPGEETWPDWDVVNKISQYGQDTAFFVTNCGQQIKLIRAVAEYGAIYPQPCCPSPLHGFPLALGLVSNEQDAFAASVFDAFGAQDTVEKVVAKTTDILQEKAMLGRVSTWPAPVTFLFTHAGVEYAIKWINGEVPKEDVDVDTLKQIMEENAGVKVYLTPFVDDGSYGYYYSVNPTGETYDNYLLVQEDYLTYGAKSD